MLAVIEGRLHHLTGPFWLWVAFGMAGSIGIVAEGTTIGSNPPPATVRFPLNLPEGSYGLAHAMFYLAVGLLTLGWVGVGLHALAGRLTTGRALIALGCWGWPLFVGTPVFSRDVYSYIAQGELTHRGFNPYVVSPAVLGTSPLFGSIASVWRATTSPYGPLFVAITHFGAAVSGSSLVTEVLTFRAIELVGIALMVLSIPVLARHLHVDPGVALWLGVLSPLALFSSVSSAHNDTMMLGLMMCALVARMRGRWRLAILLFALAATVKLTALVGVPFVAVAELAPLPWRARYRVIVESIVLAGAVVALVTEFVGYGWTWMGPTALHIPTELRVLITPVVSVAHLIAVTLHAVGISAATGKVITVTQDLCEVLAVIAVIALFVIARSTNLVRLLGIALFVVVVGSPTVWPWYFLWGLTFLAVTSAQRSFVLVVIAGMAMLLVGPGGTPMIGGNGFYVTAPLLLGGLVWFFSGGRWRVVLERVDRVG